MSSIQEVSAEQLAKLLFIYREALAHDCTERCAIHEKPEGSSWERTPQSERRLMVAAARLALLELSSTPAASTPGRKYYAKPGEADWGC
ncbi:MAG TPA: hypothetical protein VKT29_01840 [Terriglobales bacterium]|nr:hypothetical protein [Terriglobales bacterium]